MVDVELDFSSRTFGRKMLDLEIAGFGNCRTSLASREVLQEVTLRILALVDSFQDLGLGLLSKAARRCLCEETDFVMVYQ